MADSFETQIDKFVIDTEEKTMAVLKTAIQSTVNDMQTPMAQEGGRMRVKTGFLRSSGVAALNLIPAGPSKGDGVSSYSWAGDFLGKVLLEMKPGDTFIFGWTANYARVRETYDGFLEAGLQNWQNHVNNAVSRFRK